MINTFKTLTAAAAFATVGFAAQAATVAEITSVGSFGLLEFSTEEALAIGGRFAIAADPGFDTSETNDFLFELDFTATGLPVIDEELFVPGITGDAILGIAFALLGDIELAFPGALDAIVDEVLDGDLLQSEIITGLWFGFDFGISGSIPGGFEGSFEGLLSETDLTGLAPTSFGFASDYSLSATISTVPAVPLPATLPLLALGGAGLMALGRRRKS